MAVATSIAVGGAISAGMSYYGAKKAAKAQRESSRYEAESAQEALDWEKEQEEQRRKEYLEERERKWEQEEKEWAWRERERAETAEERAYRRKIEEQERARKYEITRPYTDLGMASASSLHNLMRPQPSLPSPVGTAPSIAVQRPPIAVPQPRFMPEGAPPDPTLAALAGRRV